MTEKLKTVDADTLLSTPLGKTFFVVEELIPQGVSLLCGASKIGKSWLMLWLSLRVSQGLPVWDYETCLCGVLYLCLEDTFTRIQNRLYSLTDSAPDNLRFAVMSSQIGNGLEQQITDYLAEFPATKLLIIDTLQKVRDSRGNNGKNGMYGSDYEDMSAIKAIADRFGIAIVLVHHLRKLEDSGDPFNQVSGTTGITGAVDTTFVLKKDNRTADTATLLATGRDIEFKQLTLRFENRIWQLVDKKNSEELHKEEIPVFLFRLIDFMKERTQWCGSATELLCAMDEHTVSPNTMPKLLSHFYYDVLLPNGIDYKTSRTGKSRLITLIHSDSNDTDDGKSSI